MSDEAKKRLQALQEMSYLGAGFRLALRDLEIRGAGNIFGPEQSGHIHEIGFDLYIEMLEKAVAEMRGEEIAEEIDCASPHQGLQGALDEVFRRTGKLFLRPQRAVHFPRGRL